MGYPANDFINYAAAQRITALPKRIIIGSFFEVYDAMTGPRPNYAPKSHEEALHTMETDPRNSGKLFSDPFYSRHFNEFKEAAEMFENL
jgi:hypothetical protein